MTTSNVIAAAEQVRRWDQRAPEIAVILGSGLSALIEAADDRTVISTNRLPGYPGSTVEGHEGRLVVGRMDGQVVLFVQGRVHCYEGYSVQEVTFPVRMLHALGVERLIVTNAAGGINPNFVPASLMFITDHISLRSLEIPAAEDGQRSRTGTHAVYDAEFRKRAVRLALDLGIRAGEGVYLWTQGPNYETPAEVRAFALIGADAVGMSTVPESVQAHLLDMEVLGISMITNRAAGLHDGPLTHEEVLATAAQLHDRLTHLVRRMIGLRNAG